MSVTMVVGSNPRFLGGGLHTHDRWFHKCNNVTLKSASLQAFLTHQPDTPWHNLNTV